MRPKGWQGSFAIGACTVLHLCTNVALAAHNAEISTQELKGFINKNMKTVIALEKAEKDIEHLWAEARDDVDSETVRSSHSLSTTSKDLDALARELFKTDEIGSYGFVEKAIPEDLLYRRRQIEDQRCRQKKNILIIKKLLADQRQRRKENIVKSPKFGEDWQRRIATKKHDAKHLQDEQDEEAEERQLDSLVNNPLIVKPESQVCWEHISSIKPVFWMAEFWRRVLKARQHFGIFESWVSQNIGLAEFGFTADHDDFSTVPEYENIGPKLFDGRMFGERFIFDRNKPRKDLQKIQDFIDELSKDLKILEKQKSNIFRKGRKMQLGVDAKITLDEITAIVDSWRKSAVALLDAYNKIPPLSGKNLKKLQVQELGPIFDELAASTIPDTRQRSNPVSVNSANMDASRNLARIPSGSYLNSDLTGLENLDVPISVENGALDQISADLSRVCELQGKDVNDGCLKRTQCKGPDCNIF